MLILCILCIVVVLSLKGATLPKINTGLSIQWSNGNSYYRALGKGFSNCSQWESSNENWLPARGLFVPRKQNEARKRLWYIYVFLAVYRNEMNFVLTLAEVEAADKRYPATP